MKRSSANAIYKARNEFSRENTNPRPNSETYFSPTGCDVCNIADNESSGAGDVVDMVYYKLADVKKKVFDNAYGGRICNGCLVSLHNADDSDLDYHVDDEDVADIRE